MKRPIVIISSVVLVVTAAIFIYSITSGREGEEILEAEVQKGNFEILINVTGELQAQSSEMITAPMEMRSRNVRIENVRIQDLIPEGTIVKEGDYVAQLDRSSADNRLKDLLDQLEQAESQYEITKLDTTIQLRNLRDEIINLRFNLEEMEITLEQSKYEPPATIRQAQINLDKAKRALEQAEKNYKLKVQQAVADMRERGINLSRARREVGELQQVIEKFTIRAPAPGMLIYYKEWGGEKRKVGSTVSPWDLTVATLPDLTSMISKTYVNEIDISKVKAGQSVRIGVDAFPEKSFTGRVQQVANIGEQLPNTDAKVFEVTIMLDEVDPILRPAMTTSNRILTALFRDTLFIPLEAVHADDSIPYVVKRKGTKQIVVLGESNENMIIVEKGLSAGEKIYLSLPEGHELMKKEGQELVALILEKARLKKLEEERQKEEAARAARQRAMYGRMAPGMGGQFQQGGQRVMIQSSDRPENRGQRTTGPEGQIQTRRMEVQRTPADTTANKKN